MGGCSSPGWPQYFHIKKLISYNFDNEDAIIIDSIDEEFGLPEGGVLTGRRVNGDREVICGSPSKIKMYLKYLRTKKLIP